MQRTMAAVLAAALMASGCDALGPDDEDEPFESFGFKYSYAIPAGQDPLGQTLYTITDPLGGACPGVPASLSLEVLAGIIQREDPARNAIADAIDACGGLYLVAGAAVTEVRDDGLPFDYRTTGGNNAVIRANRLHFDSTQTAVHPASITIQTTGGLTVGSPTTLGTASIGFISPFKAFDCENGGPVWSDNFNRPRATFFEIRLTDEDTSERRVEGEFRCIARNGTDTSDERLLLVTDGAFSMISR